MLTKIIDPSGWNYERPVASLVKVSSRGLTGRDRDDFIKAAGDAAPAFVDAIDGLKFGPGEVPVHLIAFGANEKWGSNRNGDAFDEPTCRNYHDTFVKHARPFRNHRNKPHEGHPHYGSVKASAYNDAMHRVELLVGLHETKEAADRNGPNGLVADRELEKLAKTGSYPVSMACVVAHDKCASCGHYARTREEYCDERSCVGPHGEKRGGCKDNLTKVAADGFVNHVLNPGPRFFDISHVWRPADRTAYASRADWLEKAASHQFVPGAELAEMLGVTAPPSVAGELDYSTMPWDERIGGLRKLAEGMACGSRTLECTRQEYAAMSSPPVAAETLREALGRPGTTKCANALAALADRSVLLTVGDFARWIGKAASAEEAAALVPAAFENFCHCRDGQIRDNPYGPAAGDVPGTKFAAEMARTHSLRPDDVRNRAVTMSLRGAEKTANLIRANYEKSASAGDADPGATALAEAYALYKLATLYRIAERDPFHFPLTARLALGQNRIR